MSKFFPSILLILLILSLSIILVMCSRKSTKQQQSTPIDPHMTAVVGPPVIVYKTKADYSQHVPIILSADKKELISYPAPGDLYYKGELAIPYALGHGYLLDRRGINENAVFIALTYEAYSQLEQAPRVAELMDMIIDMDPFLEIYHCGMPHQYKELESELSVRAEAADWSNCKRLK